MRRWGLALAMTAGLGISSPARAITFDFESTPAGSYTPSLAVTQDGLTLTITPEGYPGGSVVVVDNFSIPVGMGSRSVIGSQVIGVGGGGFSPLRFAFSKEIDEITFLFGDGGGDDDSPVTIHAYSAAGALLGTGTRPGPWTGFPVETMTLSFEGASYYVLSSLEFYGNNYDSIYWEVVNATPTVIPEAPVLYLLGLGLAGIGYGRGRGIF